MTLSVLASLASHIKCLRYIEPIDNSFSIRKWLTQEDGSWLFLTAAPDQRSTLRPLITTWIDIALNGLMSPDYTSIVQEDVNLERRVWFILDELPALQRVPTLQTALAESRKYGGCVVAGVQNIPQLQTIYGPYQSKAIMNLFNTTFVFRTTDPDTCQHLARKLGDQDIFDVKENISYGANTMRDGINLNTHQKMHQLVMPEEIALLPNLECYIKYPGKWPISKIKMKLEKPLTIAQRFSLKKFIPYGAKSVNAKTDVDEKKNQDIEKPLSKKKLVETQTK